MRQQASHIRRVGELLITISYELAQRAVAHDASKWSSEEWPYYEEATPKLAGLTYGSKEYKKSLEELGPALEHHYKTNRHHPEFHADGVNDMTLIDLCELMCDWVSSGERHTDGSIVKSLEVNKKRFKISPQLEKILYNTAVACGWIH